MRSRGVSGSNISLYYNIAQSRQQDVSASCARRQNPFPSTKTVHVVSDGRVIILLLLRLSALAASVRRLAWNIHHHVYANTDRRRRRHHARYRYVILLCIIATRVIYIQETRIAHAHDDYCFGTLVLLTAQTIQYYYTYSVYVAYGYDVLRAGYHRTRRYERPGV